MTPEERALLEQTHRLAEENNDILKGLRRSGRISIAFRVIYWVVIIGFSIGAYYLIAPYASFMTKLAGDNITNVQQATNSLQDLLK